MVIFGPQLCLKKTVVNNLYVVIMVIRTKDLLAGYSRYYPMVLVFQLSSYTKITRLTFDEFTVSFKVCNAIYILFLTG